MIARVVGVGGVHHGRAVTDQSNVESCEPGFFLEFTKSRLVSVFADFDMSTRSAPAQGLVTYEDRVLAIG